MTADQEGGAAATSPSLSKRNSPSVCGEGPPQTPTTPRASGSTRFGDAPDSRLPDAPPMSLSVPPPAGLAKTATTLAYRASQRSRGLEVEEGRRGVPVVAAVTTDGEECDCAMCQPDLYVGREGDSPDQLAEAARQPSRGSV